MCSARPSATWARAQGHGIASWHVDEGISGSNGLDGRAALAEAFAELRARRPAASWCSRIRRTTQGRGNHIRAASGADQRAAVLPACVAEKVADCGADRHPDQGEGKEHEHRECVHGQDRRTADRLHACTVAATATPGTRPPHRRPAGTGPTTSARRARRGCSRRPRLEGR